MDEHDLEVVADGETLARKAAGYVVRLAGEAIAARGRFSIGLSGGSTPRALFRRLASPAWASRIDWARVHVFWGDERCVPPDDAASNYRLARETLLSRVPLPPEHSHRIAGELAPAEAARRYEAELRAFFSSGESATPQPRFDLLLLGMGDDGHTASLFPGTAALHETERWAIENYVPRLDSWRITLTVPAINAAAHAIFLVSGAAKAETLRAVLHGPRQPEIYPAQLVRPQAGRLLWLVDRAATTRL
ncbi:MAG: 6-phosphogluconolactonase [Anaerolineae bacterium]|nr:6-phosphogluconolactonase [Anaerolineae bacterium]